MINASEMAFGERLGGGGLCVVVGGLHDFGWRSSCLRWWYWWWWYPMQEASLMGRSPPCTPGGSVVVVVSE